LSCSWCDSPYTWDASRYDLRAELGRRPVADILDEVHRHRTRFTVISGGEPLLHQTQPGWAVLLDGLQGDIEVETNGTVFPTLYTIAHVSRFNVSPKLAHAGGPEAKRIRQGVLAEFARSGKAVFKFVVTGPGDLDEVAAITSRAAIPDSLVWVMPEGTTTATVLDRARDVAEAAITRGYNVTTRLHVLFWDAERAR
jgi:organic radical activating enzyme